MKKNKLTAMIAWTLIASMCMSACAENADKKHKKDDDEDETQPVIKIEIEDNTGAAETTATTEELPVETEATQPIEEPDSYDYEEAYLDVVNNFSKYSEYTSDSNQRTFDLIYFDDDSIPELVVEDGICNVSLFTYADGQVHTLMKNWVYGAGGNAGYMYAPKSGIAYNLNSDYAGAQAWLWYGVMNENYELVDDGVSRHMQIFPDDVSDPWDYIGKIEWDQNTKWYYYLGDKEVSEDEFNQACYAEIENWPSISGNYSYDEITFFLSNDVVPAYDSEPDYEIFVMDCTWEEAEAFCESKGGHLATMTGTTGWYSLYSVINDDTSDAFAFYIGGTYNEADGKYYWTADGSGLPVGDYVWRKGEPSITGKTEDGRTVNEDKMCVLVTDNNGYKNFEAMDVPNDIIDAAASYKGKVGFICEYK